METLKEFCLLREESVEGQLDGTIPSTTEGQNADGSALIDASHINITDMGSMGNTMGGMGGQEMTMPGNRGEGTEDNEEVPSVEMPSAEVPDAEVHDTEEETVPTMPQGDAGTAPTMPEEGESVSEDSEVAKDSVDREMPEGMEMPGETSAMGQNGSVVVVMVVSIVVLIAGLIFVFKFRRYK